MSVERIKLAAIRTDGGTQMRAAISSETVEEYAEAYRAGAPMPPVVVFYDGNDYWLANGFHRVEAQRRVGFLEVDAEVRPGTRRDAILHAVGCNSTNGLRPTNADKRRAVETLLCDEEWSKWSDRKIAEACGVSHNLVSTIRKSHLSSNDRCQAPDRPRLVERNGTVYEQKTGAIGKTRPQPDALTLTANMREATRDAGVLKPPDEIRSAARAFTKVPTHQLARFVEGLSSDTARMLLMCLRDRVKEQRGAGDVRSLAEAVASVPPERFSDFVAHLPLPTLRLLLTCISQRLEALR